MPLDRLSTLSKKGYFPAALPPTFTIIDYGAHVRELLREWSASGVLPADYRTPLKLGATKDTEPEVLSVPKGNRERRFLQLVHPVSQAVLNDLISRNWGTISNWLGRSRYNFGPLAIVENTTRAMPDPEFALHRAHKESIISVANWITETDITRFYPSIYTHSIAWAAYGKDAYKKNPKKYKWSLADQLDIAVRKCNRNQTVGIPIGPDSSRVIAEIISSYVDEKVEGTASLTRKEADRLQDDWLVGSVSLEQAEARLSGIIRAYQELGLDINGRKTGIRHVREATSPMWRVSLLSLRSGGRLTGDRLGEFLRFALNEQVRQPAESVLSYVYAILIGAKFKPSDIPAIQSFVTRSVVIDSRIMNNACILLLNLNHEGYRLDKERIASRFIPMLESALEEGHTFEAIWSLHLFRGLRFDLSSTRIAKLATLGEGATVALILLDLESMGLLGKLPKRDWLKRITASSLHDPLWLLAYEGVRHGWLTDATGSIRANPILAPMFARDIVFYDPTRNVPPRQNLRKLRVARNKFYMQLAIRDWFAY